MSHNTVMQQIEDRCDAERRSNSDYWQDFIGNECDHGDLARILSLADDTDPFEFRKEMDRLADDYFDHRLAMIQASGEYDDMLRDVELDAAESEGDRRADDMMQRQMDARP